MKPKNELTTANMLHANTRDLKINKIIVDFNFNFNHNFLSFKMSVDVTTGCREKFGVGKFVVLGIYLGGLVGQNALQSGHE